MGGIVKSIGKAIKKLGKGIGRFLKKYKTTIILAAALWAGLGAFGASTSGASIWSAKSVGAGVQRIFGVAVPSQAAGYGQALERMKAATTLGTKAATGGLQLADVAKYSDAFGKSKTFMGGLKKWFGSMPDWGKYALTQSGMTILGSMLDTSAEDELAARYGQMGIPYGSKVDDPTAIFDENPQWRVSPPPSWPSAPTTTPTAQTSTPQQVSLARAPATVGAPRSQQIAAMRTTPLDVRPPGMLGGRRQGLLQSSPQRRYA